MRFSLNSVQEQGVNTYSRVLLEKLIKINSHQLVENDEADIILCSIVDVTEIRLLKDIRDRYPEKKIAAGGQFCVFFKAAALFADYVNVGSGFEFFECKTEEEIRSLKCVYFNGKERIESSNIIRWDQVPIVQLTKKVYSYFGATGCPNKCKFCLTSWTNSHNENSETKIRRAVRMIQKNGGSPTIISNEQDHTADIKTPSKSMMLRNFLDSNEVTSKKIRIGLEFATEKSRAYMGKKISDKDLLAAIEKARELKIELQFFCIAGWDRKEDWVSLIRSIPKTLNSMPRIVFKFTNLEYQMHTPLWKKRREISISNYLDTNSARELYMIAMSEGTANIRVKSIKYPAHSLWRTGVSASVTMEQFNTFWALRNSKDIGELYQALQQSGVLENDYSDMVDFGIKKKRKDI